MAKKKLTWAEKQALLHSSPEYRREIFQGICKHLEEGYSLDCCPGISEPTLMECIKKYPQEFVWGEIEEAIKTGKASWEALGRAQANGTCMGNSRTWFYNMAHRYKWSDRQTVESNVNGSLSVNVVNYAKQKPPQVDEDQ